MERLLSFFEHSLRGCCSLLFNFTYPFFFYTARNKKLVLALKSEGVAVYLPGLGSAGCGLQGVLWRVVALMHRRLEVGKTLCDGVEWTLMSVY